MGKKIIRFLLFFLLLTIVSNVILGLIEKFLPVKFTLPESLVEVAGYYSFKIGKVSFRLSQTVLNTWVIMALIIAILELGTRRLSVENPGKFQIILEEYYNFIGNTFLANFKKDKKKFVPFFSALFAFILFLNLSSFLFPFIPEISKNQGKYYVKHFFRTPTADPNTAIGLSLVVAVLFLSVGIKRKGLIGYVKTLMHPAWFMLPINIVGEISKVLNTSMRLFGNMLAGIVIGGLLYSLTKIGLLTLWTNNMLKGDFSFSVMWPMLIQLYLDGFVGIIQAFVFTMLSSVYVGEVLTAEE